MNDSHHNEIFDKRVEAANEVRRLKTVIAECDIGIAATLDMLGESSIVYKHGDIDYVFTKRKGSRPRTTLDETRLRLGLMNRGVPPEVISEAVAEATKTGEPGKPGISMRQTGASEEE